MPNIDYRARLTGAALLLAPGLLLASLACQHLGATTPATLTVWLSFCAWVPGSLCLEHFLKKVSDRWAACANAVGLLGALVGTNAVAAKWALGPHPQSELLADRVQLSLNLSSGALALALLIFSIGYLNRALVPRWIALCMALGALCWMLAITLQAPSVLVAAHLALGLSCGWIGWRLFTRPGLWNQPYLK
jgi:hypothetical protein